MKYFALACLLSLGCSSSEDAPVAIEDSAADSAVTDSAVTDSPVTDSPVTDSAVTEVAADSSLDASDSSPGDALDSAIAEAGDAMSDSGCDYVDLDDVVVKCADKYRLLGSFDVTPASAACPPYWGFGDGAHYPTKEAAIAGKGCETSCIYKFATAVTRLWCGHKSGYETLKADGCDDVYRFSEGYYPSVEAHDAANPCPP